MSHMSLPATSVLEPVRCCEEAGTWGNSHVCVYRCALLWAFLDIWDLVHTGTTVIVDLVGSSHFQPPENGTRMATQNEVLATSLWLQGRLCKPLSL